MEYFYITCSIASLLAFAGYIIDRFILNENRNVTYSLIGFFVVLTIGFWGWFYFSPTNTVKQAISERTNIKVVNFEPVEQHTGLSTVEGKFEVRNFDESTVLIPSFVEPPKLFISRPEDTPNYLSSYPLNVFEITTDSFKYDISSSNMQGTWVYRARGKLLIEKRPNKQINAD